MLLPLSQGFDSIQFNKRLTLWAAGRLKNTDLFECNHELEPRHQLVTMETVMRVSPGRSPVAVEMQAAHGGGVPVQRVHALATLGVPHAQRPVGGAADHRGDGHLAAPHAAAVARQRAQALGGGEDVRTDASFCFFK